ncbi:MAG: hypothetical protein A2Y93_03445 [Chloroflexi bacterium RBG_13_68_17]|jgi:hypothetical protein|nr:MAG: hypothetical protein A2Y93_03445 [Chloroflexi bacterium RBG_13_68_17]
MSAYATRTASFLGADGVLGIVRRLLRRLPVSRGATFGLIILAGMIGFEIFNYSTTQFALLDLMGDQRFAGVAWATILALAFCAIDFAGIARLFTPERERQEPAEVWYLLGAWFLAATMNAMLTWWGVSLSLLGRQALGNEILSREALLTGVPVFVAVLVWLIRVLMIGTLTLGGDRLFSQAESRSAGRLRQVRPESFGHSQPASAAAASGSRPHRPAPKPAAGDPDYSQRPLAAQPPSRPQAGPA